MSADNYITIVKEGDEYVGYHRFASDDDRGTVYFRVGTIEEAIMAAQSEYTEYGYRFENLNDTEKGEN